MALDQGYYLIVAATFYREIADEMIKGATQALEEAGASYDIVEVPGAFEVPGAIRFAVKSLEVIGGRRRYDGYVALGCVIRGETSHYDYVCGESARGLMDLTLNYSLALGYGILTCENSDQAWARARLSEGNKGRAAAEAAVAMVAAKRQLGFHPR